MIKLVSLLLLFPTLVFAEVIKIGAIASLQGGAAEQGRGWLDGAELAASELDGAVKLIVEDDETKPAKAATSFQKLSKIDKVQGVIGGTWDFLAQAIFPLAERDGVTFVTPSNPKEIISDGTQSFTNGLSLAAEAVAIRSFLHTRKFKTAAIVSVQVPFATAHAEMMRELFKESGIKLLQEIELALEDQLSSFKTAAQRVKRVNPELIYLVADYNQLDIFAAELQNLRWQPSVLTVQHLSGAYQLSRQNDERYRNIYAVYPKYDRSSFDRKFLKRFGRAPQVFAAEGYDALMFLHGFLTSEDKRSFSYDGLKGLYRVKAGDRALLDDVAEIVQIESGVLRVVD